MNFFGGRGMVGRQIARADAQRQPDFPAGLRGRKSHRRQKIEDESSLMFSTPLNLKTLFFRFRVSLGIFIVGLVLSGVTAFPLLHELRLLANLLGAGGIESPEGQSGLIFWIVTVRNGLEATYAEYPWVAYGTDWLAYGHLVIALFFIGPLIDPLTSRTTLYAGVAACLGVIPLALICGPIRGIPFYWQLVDCSFGVIGILPLLYCLRLLGHHRSIAS
jgi:hypothetical protein